MLHAAFQDLRFAARSLFLRPGFTLVAVASLALGIGANTTIFTMVSSVFLNPLPVSDPARLAVVYTEDQTNAAFGLTQMSHPNYEDYRDQNQVFTGLAAWGFPIPTAMLAEKEPEQVFTELVSGNYFEVMGIEPALGRFLTPAEDRAEGGSPVVVMSHRLWSRRFGLDPSVVGRAIALNGITYDVIGVAPEGFQGVNALFSPDLWAPMAMYRQVLPAQFHQWFEDRRALFLNVGGRLKPGIETPEAQAQMKTLASALEREYPEPNKGRTIVLRPLTEATIFPGIRDALVKGGALLMTIVGLVLLIACFNVANLLLAKASGRRKEIAVRLALGAGRGKLVRQLLSESLLLGLLGGALGLIVAFWGKDLIWSMRPPFLAQNMVDLDHRHPGSPVHARRFDPDEPRLRARPRDPELAGRRRRSAEGRGPDRWPQPRLDCFQKLPRRRSGGALPRLAGRGRTLSAKSRERPSHRSWIRDGEAGRADGESRPSRV